MTGEFASQRQVNEHHEWLTSHDVQIRDLELWKAEVRDTLKTLSYMLGLGMGLPATAATLYALSQVLGK